MKTLGGFGVSTDVRQPCAISDRGVQLRRLPVLALLLLLTNTSEVDADGWLPLAQNAATGKYYARIVANGCAAPTAVWLAGVDGLANALTVSSALPLLDALYILGAADQCTAKINFANPNGTNDLSVSGSCTFVAYVGYTGDGATCALPMTVNMNALTNLSQNNAHEGLWASTVSADSKGTLAGVNAAGVTTSMLGGIGTVSGRVTASGTQFALSVAGSPGWFSADRNNSATVDGFLNGTKVVSAFAQASGTIQARAWTLFQTGASTFGDGTLCEADLGAALSASQEAQLYAALFSLCGTGTVPH